MQRFTAVHEGPDSGVGSITDMVTRAWELDSLGEAYEQWLAEATQLLADEPTDDEAAFARRSELVHGWRKFLFRDPGLPRLLLPDGLARHRGGRLLRRPVRAAAARRRPARGRLPFPR